MLVDLTPVQTLGSACVDLACSATMVDYMLSDPRYPPAVKANWSARLEALIANVRRETEEIHGFAESWD